MPLVPAVMAVLGDYLEALTDPARRAWPVHYAKQHLSIKRFFDTTNAEALYHAPLTRGLSRRRARTGYGTHFSHLRWPTA